MSCSDCPHLDPTQVIGHELRKCRWHDTPVSLSSWCAVEVYRVVMLGLAGADNEESEG